MAVIRSLGSRSEVWEVDLVSGQVETRQIGRLGGYTRLKCA
jgi:hypothetical protein